MSSPGTRDRLKRQWADPDWAARQRAKISAGLRASDKVSEAAKARCDRESLWSELQDAYGARPYAPGVDPKPSWLRHGKRTHEPLNAITGHAGGVPRETKPSQRRAP